MVQSRGRDNKLGASYVGGWSMRGFRRFRRVRIQLSAGWRESDPAFYPRHPQLPAHCALGDTRAERDRPRGIWPRRFAAPPPGMEWLLLPRIWFVAQVLGA